tara:strand:+ start:397 stop:498 length:102 start_codon:yes stop_codon:yes gene_type:complete
MIDLDGIIVEKIDIDNVKTRTLQKTNKSKFAGI